jgi:hypothetical protein
VATRAPRLNPWARNVLIGVAAVLALAAVFLGYSLWSLWDSAKNH